MTLQTVASLMSVIDDTSKAKAKTNETFIVQASLTIVTYDHQNMFLVPAIGEMSWLIVHFSHPLT